LILQLWHRHGSIPWHRRQRERLPHTPHFWRPAAGLRGQRHGNGQKDFLGLMEHAIWKYLLVLQINKEDWKSLCVRAILWTVGMG
jgi:hypothetical protein